MKNIAKTLIYEENTNSNIPISKLLRNGFNSEHST